MSGFGKPDCRVRPTSFIDGPAFSVTSVTICAIGVSTLQIGHWRPLVPSFRTHPLIVHVPGYNYKQNRVQVL